jgi:peptidoglycan/xylan/chitin deacetylase (PgdA/CDA1 family)
MGSVTFRTALDRGLRWSPAQVAFRMRSDRRLAVLAYHRVEDADRFEQHLGFFQRQMRPIGLEDLADAVRGRSPLPRRALLLTFDDGDRSLVDVVLPMLRERAFPAVAFLIPGLLGSDRLFWWDEVEELIRAGAHVPGFEDRGPGELVGILKRLPTERRVHLMDELRTTSPAPPPRGSQVTPDELRLLETAGIEIGNHTFSHASLARSSLREVKEEVTRAHDVLTTVLGHPPQAFAYPNGDWAPTAENFLRDLGYETAFLFDHRTQSIPVRDPLRISRLRVGDSTSMDRLRIILSGLHPAVHRLRGLS